ncbi:GNAT family N-acetyltransferase [Streptomyces prunicolor]|uniref:GNAT family N-acetyltransferase n=1 Tax=Streptomyces prunicolor TaxID=67348 RepID=UPI00371DE5A3
MERIGSLPPWNQEPPGEPVPAGSQLPASSLLLSPLPQQMTTHTNQVTLTRTAVAGDLDAVNAMHSRCSSASRFARYHAARQTVAVREWGYLCDPANGTTLITVPVQESSRIVAVTHLLRTSVPHVRELGILIEDSWQEQGLGTTLTRYTVDLARTHTLDCHEITAMTGSGNQRMLSILRGLNARVTGRNGPTLDTVIHVEA